MGNKQKKIDLWSGTITDLESDLEYYVSLLSPDEQVRMQQYRIPERGKMYALVRGWMRTVLAQYARECPQMLQIHEQANGKPTLTFEKLKASRDRIEFNLSHSSDQFMLCVAVGRKLGLDLEQIRNIDNMNAIARTFFSNSEFKYIYFADDETSRKLRFFEAWTRLEAYYKWSCSEQSDDVANMTPNYWTRELIPGYMTSLVTEGRSSSVNWILWKRGRVAW